MVSKEGIEKRHLPLISAIIPVYNAETYLPRCVESVRKQTYTNLEILLIDDGSTDSSGEICDKYVGEDLRIKAIHIPNGGVSRARNTGLERCTGEYETFIDADDLVSERYIERLYETAVRLNAQIVTCAALNSEENEVRLSWEVKPAQPYMVFLNDQFDYLGEPAKVSVWGALYAKAAIREICFDVNLHAGEDALFFAQVFNHCKKFAYLPEKLYQYISYKTSSYHGPYNRKTATELEAWRKIYAVFQPNYRGKILYGCKARYAWACGSGLKNMAVYNVQDDKLYAELLKETQKALKEVWLSTLSLKTKLLQTWLAIAPRSYLYVYKKLKQE